MAAIIIIMAAYSQIYSIQGFHLISRELKIHIQGSCPCKGLVNMLIAHLSLAKPMAKPKWNGGAKYMKWGCQNYRVPNYL